MHIVKTYTVHKTKTNPIYTVGQFLISSLIEKSDKVQMQWMFGSESASVFF